MSYSRNGRGKLGAALSRSALVIGVLSLVSGVFLLAPILMSTVPQELGYLLRSQQQKQIIPEVSDNKETAERAQDLDHSQGADQEQTQESDTVVGVTNPISPSFGVVIPKIGANAAIIPNVDPYNEAEYQQRLTQGIAHAEGTVYPGDTGNMFLFAHSAANSFQARRYNAVFYLLNKLQKGDPIYIFYQGERYTYRVRDLRFVDASEVSYLSSSSIWDKQLTLMTCWPPGTTLQRLLVLAEL